MIDQQFQHSTFKKKTIQISIHKKRKSLNINYYYHYPSKPFKSDSRYIVIESNYLYLKLNFLFNRFTLCMNIGESRLSASPLHRHCAASIIMHLSKQLSSREARKD